MSAPTPTVYVWVNFVEFCVKSPRLSNSASCSVSLALTWALYFITNISYFILCSVTTIFRTCHKNWTISTKLSEMSRLSCNMITLTNAFGICHKKSHQSATKSATTLSQPQFELQYDYSLQKSVTTAVHCVSTPIWYDYSLQEFWNLSPLCLNPNLSCNMCLKTLSQIGNSATTVPLIWLLCHHCVSTPICQSAPFTPQCTPRCTETISSPVPGKHKHKENTKAQRQTQIQGRWRRQNHPTAVHWALLARCTKTTI